MPRAWWSASHSMWSRYDTRRRSSLDDMRRLTRHWVSSLNLVEMVLMDRYLRSCGKRRCTSIAELQYTELTSHRLKVCSKASHPPWYAVRYSQRPATLTSLIGRNRLRMSFDLSHKVLLLILNGPRQINGLVFTSYSFFMKLQMPPHSAREPSLGQIFASGAGSGVLSS